MALLSAFQSLERAVHRLEAELGDLRVSAVEDPPSPGDVALVDLIGDNLDELLGRTAEAAAGARRAVAGVEGLDLHRARQGLRAAQDALDMVEEILWRELGCHDAMAPLVRLGMGRRGAWEAWVSVVKQAVEACHDSVIAARRTVATCWQELAERAQPGPVYVQPVSRAAGS